MGSDPSPTTNSSYCLRMGVWLWIFVFSFYIPLHEAHPQQVCTTPGCTRAANYLLNTIDPSVNPCDDFFAFACGGYDKQHPLIDGELEQELAFDLSRKQIAVVQSYLDQVPFNKNASIADKRVAKAYQLCLNIDKDGLKPLLPRLTKDGLAFLTSEKEVDERFDDWLRESAPFPFWMISPDDGNSSLYNFAAPPPMSDVHLNKMYEYKVKQTVMLSNDLFGRNIDESVTRRILDFVALNRKLNEIRLKNYEANLLNPSKNSIQRWMTMRELKAKFPIYRWEELFQQNDPGFKFILDTNDALYFQELGNLFSTGQIGKTQFFDQQKSGELDATTNMIGPYRHLSDDVFSTITSLPQFCASLVIQLMGRWSDDFYMDHINKKEDFAPLKALAEDVHRNYLELLQGEKWLSKESRSKVYQEIKNMTFFVGPMERWEKNKIDSFYQSFTLIDKATTIFDFMAGFSTFQSAEQFKGWNNGAVTDVNAGNMQTTFLIFLGIMVEPMYSWDFPLEVNYGAMGVVIGHEITHSIDSALNQSWLTKEEVEKFNQRVECVAAQYGNVSIPLSHSNATVEQEGHVTLRESVSDITGIRVAYKAYKKERARQYGKRPSKLPGLEKYSNDQLFFISSAQLFCGRVSDEAKFKMQFDVHPFNFIRPQEEMKDFEKFAEAFKCPLNSPMNPEKKCRVWRRL